MDLETNSGTIASLTVFNELLAKRLLWFEVLGTLHGWPSLSGIQVLT